jgi:hypothetical protein
MAAQVARPIDDMGCIAVDRDVAVRRHTRREQRLSERSSLFSCVNA